MGYLKELICICATAITAYKLFIEGDGQTLVALFTLYGALFGWDMKSLKAKEEG